MQRLFSGTQRGKAGWWLLRGALVLNVGLAVSYVFLWFSAWRQDLMWSVDFSAFYTAWSIVRAGLGSRLYDLGLQATYQQAALEGRSFAGQALPFVNPPHTAVIFAPLSWLPYRTAFAAWSLLQLALLVWLILILDRLTKNWSSSERWMVRIGVLAFPAVLFNFLLGAFSLFMLICLLLFYEALRDNRQAAGGLWFLAGVLKPQTWVLPGCLLLAARRWKALLTLTLGGILVFFLTSLCIGWCVWADYFKLLVIFGSETTNPVIDPSGMYTFRGMAALLLHNQQPVLINLAGLAGLVVSILATFLLWRGHWQPEEPVFQARMALTLTLGNLFSLHAFPQDALLLVAPALLFYDYLRRRDLPRQAYAAFLLCCPAIFLSSRFGLGDSLPIRLPVVAIIVLALWISKSLWDEYKKNSSDENNPVYL